MTDRVYNVLFLCTGNSARSILAESILQKDGAGRFRAFSAGSQPRGDVNPLALKALQDWGYPAEGFRPKSWEEFAAPGGPVMDFVFTVCDSAAGEACPIWPGHPVTAHWGIEDPAAVEGTDIDKLRAFNAAFRFMKTRISLFAALPLKSLDDMALGPKLRDIGQAEGSTSARETRHELPHFQGTEGVCCDPKPELLADAPCCATGAVPVDVVIYHNPECGTSRNTLAMIRNAGIEPHVIEYLKSPPARLLLAQLIDRMGVPVRAVLREKGTPFAELGLADAKLTDGQLLDAMVAHPILINRPIVVSRLGVKLCRPSEAVLDLLPQPQQADFTKEDGERVVDACGRRVVPESAKP